MTEFFIIALSVTLIFCLRQLSMCHYRKHEDFHVLFWSRYSKERFKDEFRTVRRVLVNKKKATDPEWIDFGSTGGMFSKQHFAEWCRRDDNHYSGMRIVHVHLPRVGLIWPSFEELERLIFKDYILHQKAMDVGLWSPNYDLMCEINNFIGDPADAYKALPHLANAANKTIAGIEKSGRLPQGWNRFATRQEVKEMT